MKYAAKVNTAYPGIGLVTTGEVLTDEQVEIIGADKIDELVAREVLAAMKEDTDVAAPPADVIHDDAPVSEPESVEESQEEAATEDEEDVQEEADEDEPEELDAIDDVVSDDEQPDEQPEEKPANKPATRSGRGRRNA